MDKQFQEMQAIATHLYMKWLERIQILEDFINPNDISTISFNRKWREISLESFEKILSFLASMNIMKEGGGTFVLAENYRLTLERLEKSYNMDILSKTPVANLIRNALKLLDDKLEGGSGIWNRNDYYLVEAYYASDFFKKLLKEMFSYVLEKIKKHDKVTIFAIYHDQYLPEIESIINPENIILVTFSEKLRKLARSNCELTNEWSNFSRMIYTTTTSFKHKSDFIIIPNGLGFHHSIKDLSTIIKSNYLIGKTEILGISFSEKIKVGIEPIVNLLPNFKEEPSCKKLLKYFDIDGFDNLSYLNENEFIFSISK